MSSERSIVRSSLLVTTFTVGAALLGFLSQMVIAFLFGASAQLDAYFTAGALPLTFSGLALGGMGCTLIPILSHTREDEIPQTITSCFLATTGVVLGIALVGALGSPYTLRWTAPGLSPEKFSLCAQLQRFFWVAGGFTVIASFFGGVSHYYKQFLVPAASTLITPVCTILAGLLLGRTMGVYSIAAGYLLGCLLQCVAVFLAVTSGHRFLSPKLSPVARQFLRSSVPVMISLLPFTLISVIDAFWCARLPDGSLSYLGYANRISIGLAGVTVQGISVVIFPFLAQHSAAGETEAMRNRLAVALKFAFLFLIPTATLIFVVRVPILTLLFQRGRFDERSTMGLAAVLPWYLAGMISMAGMNIVNRGFYAIRDLRTPVLLGVSSLLFYMTLSGFLSSKYSYTGIGIAYALYWSLQFAVSSGFLGYHVGKLWQLQEAKFLSKITAVSVIVAVVLHRASFYFPIHEGPFPQALLLGVGGTVLLVVGGYFVFDTVEKDWLALALVWRRK